AGTAWSRVEVCFAAAEPAVGDAIRRLRAGGARRIAVGSWFLAPGLLTERVRRSAVTAAPDALVADPLGSHPLLPQVIVDRYRRVLHSDRPAQRGVSAAA